MTDAIRSSIQGLQQIYSVILALALGEAFKQSIVESGNASHRKVDWDKLLNLVSLLALIIPFFHGMNRYFFDTYIARALPHYGVYLLVDCIAFSVEGALFFILARSLSSADSERFYRTVVFLLSFDVFWGGFIWCFHTPSVNRWVIVNLAFVPWILAAICLFRNKPSTCQKICGVLVILRTVCDYGFSWSFYFPPS